LVGLRGDRRKGGLSVSKRLFANIRYGAKGAEAPSIFIIGQELDQKSKFTF
jgi:hypothetical protein